MTTTTTSPTQEKDSTIQQLLRQQKQTLRKQIRTRIKSSYPPSVTTTKLLAQSDLTFSRLFALSQYQNAKSVGFFLSMPHGEIQTRNAIRRIAMKDGKELFVPRVGLDFEKCDMDLIRCDTKLCSLGDGDDSGGAGDDIGGEDGEGGGELFYDSWPRNKWGIPEAPTSTTGEDVAQPGDIDLLLVPGLAFDTHGHRLGQGKGYYDRFIARMRNNGNEDGSAGCGGKEKKPFLIGVCLEEQFLEEVPQGIDLGGGGDGGIIPVSDHDYIMDMVLTPSRTLDVPKS